MYKNRVTYWSCSKLADFIRGEKKPKSLGLRDWDKWRKENKKKHPIRYWLAEKFLTKLQNFCYFPYDLYCEAKYYYENRFVTKTHYLKTNLKPGYYYELDDRILNALFNELVEFVEGEQAILQYYSEKHKKNGKKYKFKKRLCSEAGIDYLNWAMSLKYDDQFLDKKDPKYGTPTPQALDAKKIFDLYTWWKNRPNRPDPYEVTGWHEYCNKNKDEDVFSGLDKQGSAIHKKVQKLEQQYEKEDDKMLMELIKIRKSLWT